MLEAHEVEFTYREYVRDPLSKSELEELFGQLEESPRQLLRRRDKAFRELGLTGEESDAELLAHMEVRPTLLQRPIAVAAGNAVVARPVERILELLENSEVDAR